VLTKNLGFLTLFYPPQPHKFRGFAQILKIKKFMAKPPFDKMFLLKNVNLVQEFLIAEFFGYGTIVR
jgi:hypothetical protein